MNSNPFPPLFQRVYSLYLRANGAVLFPLSWEAKKERKHASGCVSHVAIPEVKVHFMGSLLSALRQPPFLFLMHPLERAFRRQEIKIDEERWTWFQNAGSSLILSVEWEESHFKVTDFLNKYQKE